MRKNEGFTLVGLIVVLVVIVFILAVLPMMIPIHGPSRRALCNTNLHGLGTAMTVYANDYDDNYPQLPGIGPWSKELGFEYDLAKPDFLPDGKEGNVGRTISASWYLLVREADVSPQSFICPQSKQEKFDGKNPKNRDITELWDFGKNPYLHVSYSMHNPYGKFPGDGSRSAAFAMAADMSPWFQNGDIVPAGVKGKLPQIITLTDKSTWKLGLGRYHESEGQNVLFADGHSSYETQPNVGVQNDNIYTYWSTDKEPAEQDKQGGTAPTSRSPENDAKSEDDSFLGI